MRYKKFALQLVMSTILGLTSVNAAHASTTNLGNLYQKNSWRVGTVDAGDGSMYCAMVNQFDDGTILAFSKDAEGYDSVAIDLHERVLAAGIDYKFKLRAGTVKREFMGHANSDKSVVIGIGKDRALFSELEQGEELRVSGAPFKAQFELEKFLASYAVLLDCMAGLNPGPAVAAAPIDDVMREKVNPRYNNLKKEFEEELQEQLSASKKKVAMLTRQQEELKGELQKQRNKVDSLKIKHEEQRIARLTMEKAITEKDAEIAKLLANKRRNSQLISELTQEREQVVRAERAATVEQRNLMDLLEGQKQRIKELEQKQEAHAEAKRELRALLEHKERELDSIRRQTASKGTEMVRELEAQEQRLVSRVETLQSKNERLQDEVNRVRADLKSAEAMLYKSKKIEMSEVLQKHRDRIAQLEERYAEQEIVREELQEQLRKKEDEIARIRRGDLSGDDLLAGDLEERSETLAKRVAQLERDNEKLREQIADTRRAYRDAGGDIADAEAAGYKRVIDNNSSKLAELKSKLAEHKLIEDQLKRELELKENQIANMKESGISSKNRIMDDMIVREQKLAAEMGGLQEQNTRLQAEIEIARRALYEAGFADKENGDIDFNNAIRQQVRKSADIAKSFSEAKKLYEDKLTELERERNDLKEKMELLALEKQSSEVEAENAEKYMSVSKRQVQEMKDRMISMAQQRERTSEALDAQIKQTKILEAALKAKEQELEIAQRSSGNTGEQLESVRAQLQKLKSDKNTLVEKLEDELKERTAQYEALKTQFDKRIGFMAADKKVVAELDLKKETLAHVNKQIKELEAKKLRLIDQLKEDRKELAAKRAQFMAQSNKQFKSSQSTLDRLISNQADYQKKLSVARKKHAEMKKQLGDIMQQEAPIKLVGADEKSKELENLVKNKLSNLEIQLASAGQQKQELADLVDKKRKSGDENIRALEAKKKELLEKESLNLQERADLERVQMDLAKFRKDYDIEMQALVTKLKDKVAEYNALEGEFDKQSTLLPTANKLQRELKLEAENIKTLQEKLAKTTKALEKEQTETRVETKDLSAKENLALAAIEDAIKETERQISKASVDHEGLIRKRDHLEEEVADLNLRLDEALAKTAPLRVRKDALEKDLADAKKRIAQLEFEVDDREAQKEELAKKLDAQNEIVKSLQKQLETTSKAVPLNFKNTVELSLKQEEIDRLERDLAVVRDQYSKAMDEIANAQDKIAELSQQKSQEAQGMTQKLYQEQSKLYELKRQLTRADAEMAPLMLDKNRAEAELQVTKVRLTELEAEMIQVAQEKQALSVRLEEQIQQNHALQDTLAAKEQEVFDLKNSLDETNRRLAEMQGEMDALKPEYTAVVNDLVFQLKNKISQYDDLQEQFDSQLRSMPTIVEVEAEMEANKASLEALERELVKVNAERRRAEEESIRAKAELEKALIQMDALRGNLAGTDRVRKLNDIKREAARSLEKVEEKEALDLAEVTLQRRQRAEELARKKREAAVKFKSRERIVPRASNKEAKKTISKAEQFLSSIMSRHRSSLEGKPTASTGNRFSPKRTSTAMELSKINKKVELKDVLGNTGVAINNFATVEQNAQNVVSQWNAGRMSGLYEQVGAAGNFQSQVNGYIDRYRSDCTAGLKVRVTPPKVTNAGKVATADLECNMKGNNYANSIAFLESNSGFSAFTHTSYPEEKARVRNVRDSIVRTLERSEGFTAPRVIKKVESTQYKFNIPALEEEEDDGIETIVIQ